MVPEHIGSRPSRFKVMWRHQSRNHLIHHMPFPMVSWWNRASISSRFWDIRPQNPCAYRQSHIQTHTLQVIICSVQYSICGTLLIHCIGQTVSNATCCWMLCGVWALSVVASQQSSLTWQPSAEVQSMTVTMSHCAPSAGLDSSKQHAAKDRSDDVEMMSSDSSSSSSSDEWLWHSLTHTWYTGCAKKVSPSTLHITSSNTGRFSEFFHCHILLEICNKAIIKYPTSAQTCHYSTVWNTNVRKRVNQ